MKILKAIKKINKTDILHYKNGWQIMESVTYNKWFVPMVYYTIDFRN